MQTIISDNRKNNFLVFSICAIFVSIPLVLTVFVPSVDFYNHAVRHYILSGITEFDSIREYYQIQWGPYPNTAADVIGAAIFRVFGADYYSLFFVVSLALVLLIGVYFLARANGSEYPAINVILASLFFYNYVFHWGFLNFLFGAAAAFIVIGGWIKLRERSVLLALAFAAAAAIPLYLVHGFAFILYGLILFSYEVGCQFERNQWSLKSLFRSGGLLVLTAIPAVILVLWQGFEGNETGRGFAERLQAHYVDGTIFMRLLELVQIRSGVLLRQLETSNATFDLFFNVAVYVLLICALATGLISLKRRWTLVLMALAAAFIVCPPSIMGVGYTADRIPTVFLLLFAAVATPKMAALKKLSAQSVLLSIMGMVILRTVVLSVEWSHYNALHRDVVSWSQHVKPGDIVGSYTPRVKFARTKISPHCKVWPLPFAWVAGAGVPIFAAKGVQPVYLDGRLAENTSSTTVYESLKFRKDDSGFDEYNSQKIESLLERDFDYIFTCVQPGYKDEIYDNDGFELVEENELFRLYRARK